MVTAGEKIIFEKVKKKALQLGEPLVLYTSCLARERAGRQRGTLKTI